MAIVPLPPRQHEVFVAICDYKRQYDCTPSVRQIAEVLGVKGPATIHKHLQALVRKGAVRRLQPGSSRLIITIAPDAVRRRPADPCTT